MKTNKFVAAAFAAAGLLTTGAFAQNQAPSPAPNEVVYVQQLPSAAELTRAAAAQNVQIERIDQTQSQVVVVYKYSNGQENTVAYQPLSQANAVPTPTTPAPAATTAPQTTVVYSSPYYYDPYYYPGWGWWGPPVVVGFGFHGGWGFRGHWR